MIGIGILLETELIRAINKLCLTINYLHEIRTTNDNTHPVWGSKEQKEWHNGICIFILQK